VLHHLVLRLGLVEVPAVVVKVLDQLMPWQEQQIPAVAEVVAVADHQIVFKKVVLAEKEL